MKSEKENENKWNKILQFEFFNNNHSIQYSLCGCVVRCVYMNFVFFLFHYYLKKILYLNGFLRLSFIIIVFIQNPLRLRIRAKLDFKIASKNIYRYEQVGFCNSFFIYWETMSVRERECVRVRVFVCGCVKRGLRQNSVYL